MVESVLVQGQKIGEQVGAELSVGTRKTCCENTQGEDRKEGWEVWLLS